VAVGGWSGLVVTMIGAPAKIVSTTLELLSCSTRRPWTVPIYNQNTVTYFRSS